MQHHIPVADVSSLRDFALKLHSRSLAGPDSGRRSAFFVTKGGEAQDNSSPPKKGLLELAVGESYTFDIEITSAEPFLLAMALGDEYYPGRGVFFHGSDTARHTTFALLQLTITGKEPTAFLPDCVAPAAVVAGIRFPGGVVISERFDFDVRVVP